MSRLFYRSIFFLTFCFFINNTSFATHIVGGEILLKWRGNGNFYQVILNKYINEVSVRQYGYGTNNFEKVYIFEKGTNKYIREVNLDLKSNTLLNTNANFCTDPGSIVTSLQVYKGDVDITALKPNGDYYITWEDCCRNQDIVNLRDPINETIALYTEFKGGSIISNSPVFVPLGNDFFCRNNLNLMDLSAVDSDGDVLVYSLVSPRSTVYPSVDVVWSTGRSGNNPIPGKVPFTINSTTGIITFNPYYIGIYVFGIKVEEYRNGQKIGEVRKDFQLNVQDCPVNNKPKIAFQDKLIKETDTLTVQLRGSTCFPLYVTDIDATQFFISETIFLNTQSTPSSNSKNAPFPALGLTLPASVPLTGFRDTARFQACFDPCGGGLNLDETAYYPFKVIINDNRCPAQYDTLDFTIKVDVGTNALPQVFIDPPTAIKKVKVYEPLSFNVYGTDSDASDLLSLSILNTQQGMNFINVKDSSSTISSTFTWLPNCNDLSPGIYDVAFIIKDNSCRVNPTATVHQKIFVYQEDVSFDNMFVTNLITPNGDGLNDTYYIPGIPIGNCDKYFKGIEIYNRWGSRIFYSQNREFIWVPNVSDGIYFYSIDLNYEVRKGWLQVTQ